MSNCFRQRSLHTFELPLKTNYQKAKQKQHPMFVQHDSQLSAIGRNQRSALISLFSPSLFSSSGKSISMFSGIVFPIWERWAMLWLESYLELPVKSSNVLLGVQADRGESWWMYKSKSLTLIPLYQRFETSKKGIFSFLQARKMHFSPYYSARLGFGKGLAPVI